MNTFETPLNITFHGADGSGKSTIAQSLAGIMTVEGQLSVVPIGGSSYLDWLSPDIAHDFLGNIDRLAAVPKTYTEKALLYEDIAIACYGYAARLVEDGSHALIDSDPYLKRFMWAYTEMDEKEYSRYREHFEDRMHQAIGDTAPNVIVGVNISDVDVISDVFGLYARISERGGVSDYDPVDEAEMLKNIDAARAVWGEIVEPRIYDRLSMSRLFKVGNDDCPTDQVADEANKVAEGLAELLGQDTVLDVVSLSPRNR